MTREDLISIVCPVFNEKENIEWTVEEIYKTVKAKFEILIVYDFSEDTTVPVARKLQRKHKGIRLIKNKYGKGVMRAIRTGFEEAKGNILVMMAVDRTDDPEAINDMYREIKRGYDVVCPTRYSKGGETDAPLSIKSALSRIAGVSTPLILGVPTSDLTYSYKMFKKEVLEKVKIKSEDGFEFSEELVIKAYDAGFKIIEVPVVWKDRVLGKSKFKLGKWLPIYIKWYLLGIGLRVRRLVAGIVD